MLVEFTLGQIASICHGELYGDAAERITSISTDTRTLSDQALFVALRGERFDGHDFVETAMQHASAVLIEQQDLIEKVNSAVLVTDTLAAYAALSAYVRTQFCGKVVAVTGSNGKTTVKDWLAQLLSEHAQVLKTSANNNNQIGVPKTLLQLEKNHDFAIIETGTSFPGEIAKMAAVIKPDVAIITNASGCHYEGFGSIEAIAEEKGHLIRHLQAGCVAILNADDASFEYWCQLIAPQNAMSFGFLPSATLRTVSIALSADASEVVWLYQGQRFNVTIGLPGKHQVYNAMAVTLAMLALGFDMHVITPLLSKALHIPARLQKIVRPGAPLLINDCYNASPKSVEAAIDVLMMQKASSSWLILGALGELGSLQDAIHIAIGEYAWHAGVTGVVALGPIANKAAQAFSALGGQSQTCETHAEIATVIRQLPDTAAVLVKGSRSAKMEQVIDALHS